MYWSPSFLAVVFKKQEISQQVVTRMQVVASEFSKIFRPLDPHSTRASAPVLGPKPWSPLTFQTWLRTCNQQSFVLEITIPLVQHSSALTRVWPYRTTLCTLSEFVSRSGNRVWWWLWLLPPQKSWPSVGEKCIYYYYYQTHAISDN